MSEKLSDDDKESMLSDEDHARIDAILAFWFREAELSAPQVDRRMDTWFSEDAVFDHEIADRFSEDVESASAGQLEHWADEPRGRLALILLLDQFRRNIYRGTAEAYALDKKALKLCVEGARDKKDDGLSPIEKVFFFMPLQHSESPKVQAKSAALFSRLAEAVTPTYRETFQTIAHFAELHADIIEAFGRFPHRNAVLGRENTPEESEYLAGDTPDFGQEARESSS
jgi:uncharacterized protein (DUF924 family)